MTQLSVVITTWSATSELEEMALSLCKQVKPMCDELIVTEDGFHSRSLESIASIYLIHPRLGHAKNLAAGIQAATSEYVACIDSDMQIVSGNLRDLCIPGYVVSPKSVQNVYSEVAGWFFVSPREFLNKCLPYDQATQALSEGIDIWTREFHSAHKDHFRSSDDLEVVHGHDRSYGTLFDRLRKETAEEEHREIDPQRHTARKLEEPDYATKFPD